jgi:hypothetical protein
MEQTQQQKMPRLNDTLKKLVNTLKPCVFWHEGCVKVTHGLELQM